MVVARRPARVRWRMPIPLRPPRRRLRAVAAGGGPRPGGVHDRRPPRPIGRARAASRRSGTSRTAASGWRLANRRRCCRFVPPGRRRRPRRWPSILERASSRCDFRPSGVKVRIRAAAKPTHLVFEIVSVEPAGSVDAVVWGPYPTTVGATVGEIVGVVRDGSFALGLQVLNLKTRGGALLNDEGSDPSRGTLAQGGTLRQRAAGVRARPDEAAEGRGLERPVPRTCRSLRCRARRSSARRSRCSRAGRIGPSSGSAPSRWLRARRTR